LAPGAEPQLLSWDGRTLVRARGSEVTLPLVSSSVSPREAEVSRRAVLDELTRAAGGLTAEVLAAFHRSELPAPGPLAVSMSRPDAWTVSHTRIVVEPQGATLRYQAGRPSADGPAVTVALARSR
jgi:hypothetical protein